MLNYTQTPTSPPVPVFSSQEEQSSSSFLTIPRIEEQERTTQPLPEITKQQGREAGQADAKQVLTQAEQRKGAPLTKPEMRETVHPLFMARLEEMGTSDKPKAWYIGLVDALLRERKTYPRGW